MATLRLTSVNVLKTQDRGGMGIPSRCRAIASAAVAVKGLRFAPMNAPNHPTRASAARAGTLVRRALDCHPRCGCFAAMKRMSSFHVPHDQNDSSRPAKRAGPGPWLASVAHRALCWRQDTIPKPDGLAGPRTARRSNGNATKAGRCPALFVMGSRSVQRQR